MNEHETATQYKQYIHVTVAPYAIADFIRALWRNGDHDIGVTKCDNDLTVGIPLDEYRAPMDVQTTALKPEGSEPK